MSSNETSQPPTLQGTVLAGKYKVERVIGEGGMGVVVEARHIALDERVAMKFLTAGYAQHPEASARFLREARAAVKIKSEHVARVSDVGTLETGAPYMVMELLVGNDLSKELQNKGKLPLQDAVDYVIQACDAIAEAHAAGIVHRDLKPANLFLARRLDGSPLVKVLDFGISKTSDSSVENLTKTMTAMGSALYMSPEQMQQTRGVDHRTDIYALGVALYELLAGKQPYYADTLPQLCAEVLTGTPTPLAVARPDLPRELAPAIEKAYARDRAERYSSIAHFVVALAPFAPPRSQPVIERIARVANLPVPTAGAPAAPAPVAVPKGGPLLAGGGTIALDPPQSPLLGGGTVAIDAPVVPVRPAMPAPPPPPNTAPAAAGPTVPSAQAAPVIPAASASVPPGPLAPATAPNMEIAALARPTAPSSKAPIFIGLAIALIGGGVAAFFVTRGSAAPPASGAAIVAPPTTTAAAAPPTATATATATASEKPADAAPSGEPTASAKGSVAPSKSAAPGTKPVASGAASTKPAGGKGKSIFDDR